MPGLDFRKVASILGHTLNMDTNFDIARGDASSDSYTVTYTQKDGSVSTCHIVQGRFKITLRMPREAFDEKRLDRWINSFEYELEQAFLSNIRVAVEDDSANYKITVTA
ncbi:MAG: hypothetical protein JXA20_05580 [Spirochaetes bacterium]|nr:hypothetical protein [Spirochaetota bacterium]